MLCSSPNHRPGIESSWRPYRARPGEQVLAVRASGGFPPGHPTTRLCLELLGRPVPGILRGRFWMWAAVRGSWPWPGPRWGRPLPGGGPLLAGGPSVPGKCPGEPPARNDTGGSGLHRMPTGPLSNPGWPISRPVQVAKVEELARLAAPGGPDSLRLPGHPGRGPY